MIEQRVEFSFSVPESAAAVWARLWDLERVAHSIPGCQEVTVTEPNRLYRARVRRKAGPFLIGMELGIEVLEAEPPTRIRLEIAGTDQRLKSRVRQSLTVTLSERTPRETSVEITNFLFLEGMLASLSRHLIGMQVTQVLEEFAGNFSGQASAHVT